MFARALPCGLIVLRRGHPPKGQTLTGSVGRTRLSEFRAVASSAYPNGPARRRKSLSNDLSRRCELSLAGRGLVELGVDRPSG